MNQLQHIQQIRQSLELTDKAMDAEIVKMDSETVKQLWLDGVFNDEPRTQAEWSIVDQEIREWERSLGRGRY